ncbi:hypothetical protein BDR26DRAFT_797282, partial [Obelidium mucronatum]
ATESANKPGIGYRGMTDIIRLRYNVKVARQRIHASLKQANPQLSASRLGNVMFRRVYGSRGVNAVWHFDGYDKLSRFGFGIHCCTDGLSRKYMWWYIGSTNRLSVRVAGYYVKAVERAGWRPDITRTDFGSENVVVATIQGYYSDLLGLTHDGHIYGTSKRNTRIEGGWRILSRDNLKYWKTLFEMMEIHHAYQFNTLDFYHVKVAQFVFGDFIKEELNDWCIRWNSHLLR